MLYIYHVPDAFFLDKGTCSALHRVPLSREAPHFFSDVVGCWRFTYSIHAASLCIISFRSCTNNASHHSYGGREKKLAEQGTPAGIKAAVDASEAVANKATGAAK